MLNNESLKKKQNNHKHSGPRTSPLPHSVQRQKQYLFLPLQLKLPPQKSDQRVYLGTTANISRLITITSNLRRGGGEESHKCFDSFLFSIFSFLSDALRHVQRCQHLFKNSSFYIRSPQISFL